MGFDQISRERAGRGHFSRAEFSYSFAGPVDRDRQRPGFQTYGPNRAKKFNNVPLGDLTKLEKCPDLQFANYDSLRNIDVIWFREAGKQFYPHSAFEVELSTGIWSGVGRLAALREYTTRLFVVSNEHNRFEQVMQSQLELHSRVQNVATDQVGVLYSAETRLRDLRLEIGI